MSLGESLSEYCHNVWYGNLEWCGYPTMKKFKGMFTRVDRIHERDGQTVGRTPHYG